MIIALAILWYVVVPVAGAFTVRQSWWNFRRRFNALRLKPILDYRASREEVTGEYRFIGRFESLTEDHILWIRSEELTIPADLQGAQAYLLPNDPDDDLPEKLRWDRFSTLTGDARIYVGGTLIQRDDRPVFASSQSNPLQVILYEGSDHTLTLRTIRGGRYRNKYWNYITPYALVLGAFSQIITAVYFFDRPAHRSAMITAFTALFAPLIPLIPPGILFALLYRRLWWRARFYRACRDLSRLPLIYMPGKENLSILPDGDLYGAKQYEKLPEVFFEKGYPFIIPGEEKKSHDKWYVFGILNEGDFPSIPSDPFAVYGALPGDGETLYRRYARKAWVLEITAWLLFAAGLLLNLFFIRVVLFMTGLFTS